MLRLALIENLRRVGARIAADRLDRNLADSWGDQLVEFAEKDTKNLILVVADMILGPTAALPAFDCNIYAKTIATK